MDVVALLDRMRRAPRDRTDDVRLGPPLLRWADPTAWLDLPSRARRPSTGHRPPADVPGVRIAAARGQVRAV